MNEQKKKAPDLRFKGFTDDWEQRKLKALTSIYDGTHQTPKYQQNGVMFLSVENIGSLKSNKFISEKDYENNFKVKPTFHDILMTRIGTVGKVNVINTHQPIAYYVSLALIHPIHIKPYFLSYLIQSQTIQKEIFRRTLQVAFPQKINKDEIGKINVWLPNKNEQSKIEVVLSYLYTLITLQQRKLDLLKQLKKGLLQKMFADKGSKRPILRFEGFNDEWERRSFGDILINHPYKKYLAKPTNKGSYKVIQQGEHPLAGYASGQPFMRYKNVTLFGDHTCSLYKPTEPFFLATDGLKILSAENVMGYYLYTLLENYGPKLQGYKRHFNTLKSTNIKITYNLNEQRKISKLLYSADKILTNQQEKISKLNEIKKSLLQQMFI